MRHQPLRRLLGRATSLGSSFARGETGVAAIEFAMVFPFLLLVYVGTVEVAQGIVLARKVAVVERNLADMTSQERAAIDNARMNQIFAAAKAGLSPYDGSKAKLSITSLQRVNGVPTIIWSDTLSGADVRSQGYAPGAPPFDVPAGMLQVDGDSTLIAEVVYDYEPILNAVLKTSLALTGSKSGKSYMRPRSLIAIARNRAA